MQDYDRNVSAPVLRERALRVQIDDCVTRALFDGTYAKLLLSDPTTVLEDWDCPPQDYLSLRSINASNLREFAEQARALFWGVGANWTADARLLAHDDIGQLAWHDDDPLHAASSDVLLDSR
jgi:hypothetical protein